MTAQERAVRTFVYTFFANHGRPPAAAETAVHFQLAPAEMEIIYRQLHDHHAFFLEPGSLSIRMANPLSAVETSFQVYCDGRRFYANCAWDAFGISAMLNADADIEAQCADCGDRLRFQVRGGQLIGDEVVVHFVLPFRQWYDDLIFT